MNLFFSEINHIFAKIVIFIVELKIITYMKFINEEDLTEENLKEAWNEINEIREDYKRKKRKLNESSIPQFKSIEEARAYFGSIPFSEWENKMFEKYGING
jgi:N12 class adenine-specific DNA methylase